MLIIACFTLILGYAARHDGLATLFGFEYSRDGIPCCLRMMIMRQHLCALITLDGGKLFFEPGAKCCFAPQRARCACHAPCVSLRDLPQRIQVESNLSQSQTVLDRAAPVPGVTSGLWRMLRGPCGQRAAAPGR
jgi:hypothetical protein